MGFCSKPPYAALVRALDGQAAPVVPRHVYQGKDPLTEPISARPVGTGPFRFVKWLRGDSIVLADVSFELDTGGSLALLGRTGVGTTTLLLTLMGLAHLKIGNPAWEVAAIVRPPPFRHTPARLGGGPRRRATFPPPPCASA